MNFIRHLMNSIRCFFKKNSVNFLLSGISIFLTLSAIEVYLRYYTHTLPPALGNYIGTGYQDKLFGIYRYNPQMRMLLMRPNYEREMFFNRYYWHHKTDSQGFRNPVDYEQADIVLLGDSMIYGHGVEETSTVRHYLETFLRRPVVNLGIQGGYIHREYQILKHFGIALRPRYVFLFFLVNDIRDVIGEWIRIEGEDASRFLKSPIMDHETPYFDIKPASTTWLKKIKFLLGELYIFKAYGYFQEYLRASISQDQKFLSNTIREPTEPLTITYLETTTNSWQSLPLFQKNTELILAMQFHLHGLLKMHDIAQQHHIQLVNVFIYTGDDQEEPTYEIILRRFCQKNHIQFFSLSDGFKKAINDGEQVFLKGDGHFSDRGAQLAATLIYEEFFRE